MRNYTVKLLLAPCFTAKHFTKVAFVPHIESNSHDIRTQEGLINASYSNALRQTLLIQRLEGAHYLRDILFAHFILSDFSVCNRLPDITAQRAIDIAAIHPVENLFHFKQCCFKAFHLGYGFVIGRRIARLWFFAAFLTGSDRRNQLITDCIKFTLLFAGQKFVLQASDMLNIFHSIANGKKIINRHLSVRLAESIIAQSIWNGHDSAECFLILYP